MESDREGLWLDAYEPDRFPASIDDAGKRMPLMKSILLFV
jgi:hypothetical protein